MTPTRTFILEVVRVFVFAFLGSFAALVPGVLAVPDFNAGKAAVISAIVASLTVAVKAVVDFLTKGKSPVPAVGLLPRDIAP